MTRLNDLHDAVESGAGVRWDPQSVDVLNAVQTARRLRAQFVADHLNRGFAAAARWSGLTALFSALGRAMQRRRTLNELSRLSDGMLADIGLNRSQLVATAAQATAPQASHRSVWHVLAERTVLEYRRRKTIRALSAISDRMLQDIGLERADIRRVAADLTNGQPSERPAATAETASAAADVPPVASHEALRPATIGRTAFQRPYAANENLGHPSAA